MTDNESTRLPDTGRIGGYLIAPVLGLSSYLSPHDAYLRIRGEVVDAKEENENIDRGVFLEPALRNWYAKKVQAEVTTTGTIVAPDISWATYTPDGLARSPEWGAQRLLEIKSPGLFTTAKWGEEDTDEVPRETLIQGAWGVLVLNRTGHKVDRCDFAALIGGKLRLFRYDRDLQIEDMMLTKAREFMEKHVALGVPPPLTFAESDTAWIKKKYPSSERPPLKLSQLTPETQKLVRQYVQTYRGIGQWEELLQTLENELKTVVADTEGIENDISFKEWAGLDRISWKTKGPAMNAGTWKALAEELMASLTEEAKQALLKKHLPKQGVRAFVPYFRKGPVE